MNKSKNKLFIWGLRIFLLSILGMILVQTSVLDKVYLNYFIVLFNSVFIFFGIGFFTPRSDTNFFASNILAISLILAGLSFCSLWLMGPIYNIPLNNPYMTSLGIIFMISIFGLLIGGLARK